jgi:hypothetical protein
MFIIVKVIYGDEQIGRSLEIDDIQFDMAFSKEYYLKVKFNELSNKFITMICDKANNRNTGKV